MPRPERVRVPPPAPRPGAAPAALRRRRLRVQHRTGESRQDQRLGGRFVEPRWRVEQRLLGQGAQVAVRAVLVVVDLQVRSQHDARLAGHGDAAKALACLRVVAAGGDARVRAGHHARGGAPAARASPRLRERAAAAAPAPAVPARRPRPAAHPRHARRALALQLELVALQVVVAGGRQQALGVACVALQPHVDMVRQPVAGRAAPRAGAAGWRRRPAARAPAGSAPAGSVLARMRLQQRARAGCSSSTSRGASTPAQARCSRCSRWPARPSGAGDAHPQRVPQQRAVRPRERRGLVIARRQAGEQAGALRRIGGIEPAHADGAAWRPPGSSAPTSQPRPRCRPGGILLSQTAAGGGGRCRNSSALRGIQPCDARWARAAAA